MKKTKIICTMGPNTDDCEMMKQLAENGMDIARFNFSHGDYDEQLERIRLLKSVREELGLPIAMLLDTKGPEIRTGLLKDEKKVILKEGETYTLTTKEIVGDESIGHISYEGLPADLEIGNKILIDDGLIELEVTELTDTDIVCEIINGGELGMRKGVNVPNVSIKLPGITEKDKEDILFGIEQGFDFIAASFVRNAACINEIKELLREYHADISVIAKIENAEGVAHLDEIITASDGIMVARGDLGVEIPPEEVPYIQKQMIQKCNDNYKPVITATQMLDSMIRNPRPTRAEVADVANAIYDGTDAIMLSGETAMGKYPVEALRMMAEIARTTESHLNYSEILEKKRAFSKSSISTAVSYASVATAYRMNVKAIITPSYSGFTARQVSKFKPQQLLIGLSPDERILRRMQIYWGVIPIKSEEEQSTDAIIMSALKLVKEHGYVKERDMVIVTAGVAANSGHSGGVTNIMKIETI